MAERVLCERDKLKVCIDGDAERTLVAIKDGVTVRFWTDTAALEHVLKGDPIQLSDDAGYCVLEREGDRIRLEFGLEAALHQTCTFPSQDLADALAKLRKIPKKPRDRAATLKTVLR